ncbi:18853_t:CDS:2 [Acaulospora morrowiae]|uniref:18853_t:CDS:1 n=1 Tax=Acaulospora morrowiae TaxID=94023 RepID=A0A9N9A7K5_9GLOM|nr:18853_t:CDS:2 [Acaulospora morrowiae]
MSESRHKKPVLYSYFRSSCSWRVRTCLNWKGIDYEIKPVNLLKEEQEVPTLEIDGLVLTQSIAIIEYLEETHKENPLLPEDPGERALVRSIVQAIASDTQPVTNLRVIKYAGEDHKEEWAKHWMSVMFKGIEDQLARVAGDYCVGNKVTLADVCLVPQVFNAQRVNVDMTQFPTIQAIADRLLELEAFKRAHPYRQIDCPADLKEN